MTEKINLAGGRIERAKAGQRYAAVLVRAGRVRSAGNLPSEIIIEAEALDKAVRAGKFDAKAVFVDHAGLWEYPSVERMVGFTANTAYVAEQQAVVGEIGFYHTPLAQAMVDLLDELLASGQSAPDVGLSMVCWPEWQAGKAADENGRRMVGIQHVESVDLVFEPAAGGRILQALSSAKVNQESRKENSSMSEENGLVGSNEVQGGAGSEAIQRAMLDSLLEISGLPEASKERLRLTVNPGEAQAQAEPVAASVDKPGAFQNPAGSKLQSPEHMMSAIEAERAYLAQLVEEHVIQLGGRAPRGGHVQVGRDGFERLSLALEALIMGSRPPSGVQPLSGIREFYHLISGDYEMAGVFQPERVQFANVNSSTMANMVANVLNKVVVNEFMQYPQWWTPIVLEQDFTSLQAVKWITLGGVGELPTVAEGAAYTELTWDDYAESASFIKKGGYLGLTLEAIDKDDTGRLRAAPRALAQAAWLTLAKAISAIFTDNSGVGPTLSDGLALFHSTHANLGTTALSVTGWAATRLAMRKQTELNSSERLGALTAPRFLLAPPDLEITALQVLASEQDYTYALSNATAAPANAFAEGDTFNARMQAARSRVIVVDLWTDTNNWAAVADPRLYPTIGVGYRYGRAPEIFSVASPTSGLLFTNDTLPVKVRFFFAAGPVDYRGLYKHNVA